MINIANTVHQYIQCCRLVQVPALKRRCTRTNFPLRSKFAGERGVRFRIQKNNMPHCSIKHSPNIPTEGLMLLRDKNFLIFFWLKCRPHGLDDGRVQVKPWPVFLVELGWGYALRSLLLMAQFSCLSERRMRSASASGISMTVFNTCRALSYWRSSCASAVVALRDGASCDYFANSSIISIKKRQFSTKTI